MPAPPSRSAAGRSAKATAQTFARGLEVLRLINLRPGARIAELVSACGLNRVVVARLVATLAGQGYVARRGAGYVPTAQALALSDGYVGEAWIAEIAQPVVRELGATLDWPVSLATVEAGSVLVRLNTDRASPFTMRKIPVGYRLPVAASASGRVVLAFTAPRRRVLLSALAGQAGNAEVRSPTARQLAEIRAAGCAVWHSKAENVVQVAVPVLLGAEPVAALAVRCFAAVIGPKQAVGRYREPLRQAAGRIAAGLAARRPRVR
ncbi:MAG: helix-turn-helix domain-containing protein [Rhodospirillaceae bacterium]|nr:helix-turn-helix domain-containing protein [Rhodospirillaceae bacterium]